ncbi:hypothetical protein SPISAL_05555 [Spiribacter salinus M19-40]|uniref:DUF1674 domain-containing protein n=2 Tax=Spiribacter salinus TaxID=1335746 RepID=R4V8A2_9GAMM|nr:DUF1674 domain-containing protein [Spiribacter salinus]AGM41205.1 hypothetical protein SPISAL_05555 [Spiribacter salinus M19-40]MDR9414040.1 DUF1674 domain-containing protein [Spiribacter sp.]MDR9455642.1 DUF1674 domain-containing protein [Spiribacter sp.]TQF00581.1 MAG: DUF1674 domain-containing protein [Spiribacter salinus]
MSDENQTQPERSREDPEAPTQVDWQDARTWPKEVGGKKGPEPTRYGDWESNGRCTDF